MKMYKCFRLTIPAYLLLSVCPAASAQTLVDLFKFPYSSIGSSPGALLNADGAFFGTTASGGEFRDGTIFELTSQGRETTLFTFPGGVSGSAPTLGPLIRDNAGNFYGTTSYGGDLNCNYEFNQRGCGVVFKVSATGHETVLHSFSGGSDGALPFGGLVADAAGNFYGATYEGGGGDCFSTGCGTVYKITPTGTETVLYRFAGGSDGEGPYYVNLAIDQQGSLYGTTLHGGSVGCDASKTSSCGTVFKIDRTGKETLLHTFTGAADGAYPFSGLVRDSQGNLYGATSGGGDLACSGSGSGCGVVFELDSSGNESVLYNFQETDTLGGFVSNLILDSDGNLYGTTEEGGVDQAGTVFEVSKQIGYSVLYTFSGSDGEFPMAGLVRDPAGNLFGGTTGGGEGPCNVGCGVIFKLTP